MLYEERKYIQTFARTHIEYEHIFVYQKTQQAPLKVKQDKSQSCLCLYEAVHRHSSALS